MRVVFGGTHLSDWGRLAQLFVRSVSALPRAVDVIKSCNDELLPSLAKLADATPLIIALDDPPQDGPRDLARWDDLDSWLRATNDVVAIVGVTSAAEVAGKAVFNGSPPLPEIEFWKQEANRVAQLKAKFPSRVLVIKVASALAEPERTRAEADSHFPSRVSHPGVFPEVSATPQDVIGSVIGERFITGDTETETAETQLQESMPSWCSEYHGPGTDEITEAVNAVQTEYARARDDLDELAEKNRRTGLAHRFEVDAEHRRAEHWRNVAQNKQARISKLETELREAWKANSAAEARTYSLKAELKASAAAKVSIENQIDAMRGSLSWRLTTPVRGAKKAALAIMRRRAKELAAQAELIRESEYFDADWYTQRYNVEAGSGIDPAEHFLRFGGEKRLAPSPRFSSESYLDNNPDIAASGINPLIHFIKLGQSEGRTVEPVLDETGRKK